LGEGVSASAIVDTTSTKRLMLVSKTTGSEQAISLANVTGTLLDDLGLTNGVLSGRTQSTSTTAGYSNTSIASLNSLFNVDGIDFEKATNNVSDVLTGITLNFSGIQTGSDAPVLLTVAADKSKIKDKVNKFITDYNSVLTYLKLKTSTDASTNSRQVLAGDSTFVGLKIDLRNITSGVVSSVASGNPKMLTDLGIAIGRDGTLTLQNADVLDEKLSSVAAVADIFNSTNGVATKMQTVLKNMLSASAGQLDMATKTTSTQITNYTDQIARFDKRLDKQVEKYRNDFLKLQAVMAQVSQQQSIISSITQSYMGRY
jgi:flagellar hook-associated protein 2